MKERPILFSAHMVRAILAGTKTQTRRTMRRQFCHDAEPEEMCATNELGHQTSGHSGIWWDAVRGDHTAAARCPYGKPGDRLWVREAWTTHACFDPIAPRDLTTRSIHYVADGPCKTGKHRRAFHMPRWASRITLEVTGVRVERPRDISEADVATEGIQEIVDAGVDHDGSPRDAYRALWEQINGGGSWDENPWVWVIEFKRAQ